MMKKIKALWLCSWYPDRMQPQNGDFIQRHAIAASLFSDIVTIHVAPCNASLMNNKKYEFQKNTKDNLEEHILYYSKRNESLISRLKSAITYFRIYKNWLDNYIVKNGKPDIVHLNEAMRDGILALYLKKKYNISYVVSVHNTLYLASKGFDLKRRNWLYRFLTRKIFTHAALVLPVSDVLGSHLNQLFQISYKILPNVVNTVNFNPAEKSLASNFTFIHISDGSPKKNVDGIVKAFSEFVLKHPNTRLMLVGLDKQNLEGQTRVLTQSVPEIEIIGKIPYVEVANYLRDVHCCIVNSWYETFSCVIIESLACETPIISTSVGIAPELINNKNGALIDYTVEALYEAMNNMYQNYSSFCNNQNGEIISQKYSYKKIGADIHSFYSNLLS